MSNANRLGSQQGNPSTHVGACSFERWIGDLRQKLILLGALLILATLLVWSGVTHHEFVFDDYKYVTENIT